MVVIPVLVALMVGMLLGLAVGEVLRLRDRKEDNRAGGRDGILIALLMIGVLGIAALLTYVLSGTWAAVGH